MIFGTIQFINLSCNERIKTNISRKGLEYEKKIIKIERKSVSKRQF